MISTPTYFFEVGKTVGPFDKLRSPMTATLRYGPGHEEDEYGRLGQSWLDEFEDWDSWTITSEAFEKAWSGGD